jgi:mycothiol synthase
MDGAESISDRVGEALSADAAVCVCPPSGAIIGVGYVKGGLVGGGVDPAHRRRGIGTRLLRWAEERAQVDVELTVRSEALTADADALYVRHGFRAQMVETRMVRPASADVPEARLPAGVETLSWTADTAPLFFTAYRASFADRPGFPDPPAEQWFADHHVKEFRPDLSRVALAAGEPAGFVTVELSARGGWIDQLGVAPPWRRRGLAAALLTATLRQLRATDVVEVSLHVSVDNPRAIALFNRLGFLPELRRARYIKRR